MDYFDISGALFEFADEDETHLTSAVYKNVVDHLRIRNNNENKTATT